MPNPNNNSVSRRLKSLVWPESTSLGDRIVLAVMAALAVLSALMGLSGAVGVHVFERGSMQLVILGFFLVAGLVGLELT
jgi:hypothetical protein